jgi:hypothetical protein
MIKMRAGHWDGHGSTLYGGVRLIGPIDRHEDRKRTLRNFHHGPIKSITCAVESADSIPCTWGRLVACRKHDKYALTYQHHQSSPAILHIDFNIKSASDSRERDAQIAERSWPLGRIYVNLQEALFSRCLPFRNFVSKRPDEERISHTEYYRSRSQRR